MLSPTVPEHRNGSPGQLPISSGPIDIPPMVPPTIPTPSGTSTQSPIAFPAPLASGGDAGRDFGIGTLFTTDGPEVLSGPLPRYPEFLRQAGVQGRVILEATVDTTGRAEPTSVTVVAATNPGFVAPAKDALLATLFRPAHVGGRAARMRVRIPFEFTLKHESAVAH